MPKRSWRKRSMSATDVAGELPIFNPASAIGRRESQSWSTRSVVKYRRIHLIPLVVMLCFFILWIFSSPVDLETKDGRNNFVPRFKKLPRFKKPPKENGATDVDLTVLALEYPPDSFLSLSNGPYASLAVRHQPNVPLLDSHDHNPPLTDSHEPHASFSVSHELKPPLSVSHEPTTLFSDPHEPNKLLSDSYEPNPSLSVFHEISYAGISNEDAP
ncbi:hypothetical protein L2E82_12439 [Cichorium intybus]|uniref:Uncharacterized protein n=1 Tax=Cichorium intybus TaxID=13427 RepID=A0ACB9GFI4_CICIN|nr:hypothetical protein L2E82_12439 [Cichorium intybus]